MTIWSSSAVLVEVRCSTECKKTVCESQAHLYLWFLRRLVKLKGFPLPFLSAFLFANKNCRDREKVSFSRNGQPSSLELFISVIF